MFQYDLFSPEPTEIDLLKCEINELKSAQDRHRKSFFVRQNDAGKYLEKMQKDYDRQLLDLRAEINRLKNLLLREIK